MNDKTADGTGTGADRVVDARPVLLRTSDNIWERSEQRRTELRRTLDSIVEALHLEALVLQSHSYVYPAWVKFEGWLPRADRALTARSSLLISIVAQPFHRYELVYQIEWERRGAKGVIKDVHTLDETMLARLVEFVCDESDSLLRRSPERLIRGGQLRQFGYQLWRPVNKADAVRRDRLATAGWISIAVGVLFLASSGPTPERSVLDPAPSGPDLAPWGLLALIVGALLVALRAGGGRLVRSAGRPLAEPRFLRYVDSWQTVVFGAGTDRDELIRRLMVMFAAAPQVKFTCTTEHIWYWGLDGKEEREQIVLRFGRALVFCHVYAYGAHLYVGWDAQLNLGMWREKALTRGIDRESGEKVLLMTVEHASQPISEYDLVDLNCLAEWTHAQISQVLKHYLKERQIDQEIDFKIIRGERQGLTDEKDEKKSRSRFRRTA